MKILGVVCGRPIDMLCKKAWREREVKERRETEGSVFGHLNPSFVAKKKTRSNTKRKTIKQKKSNNK